MAAAPDLPAMQEAGVPGFEVNGWYGIAGPARIPANAVDQLNREFVRAVNLPDTREKLEAAGRQVVGGTPEQFGALL